MRSRNALLQKHIKKKSKKTQNVTQLYTYHKPKLASPEIQQK